MSNNFSWSIIVAMFWVTLGIVACALGVGVLGGLLFWVGAATFAFGVLAEEMLKHAD